MAHRLRSLLLVLLLVVLLVPTTRATPPTSFGGLPVVVLAGTHYERGVAHGKALHARVVDLVDNYLARKVANPVFFLAMLRQLGPLITVDAGLEAEAKGLVAGAMAANHGTFKSRYQEDNLTWQQVLALNSYVDYIGTACSSVSAWGEATEKSELAGRSAVARNLDWSTDPALLRNQALFVHLPAEENEQPFISVGFAGFLGCLSCMNRGGTGAFLNLGYGDRRGSFPPHEPFTPSALAFRRAIETKPAQSSTGLDHFVAALVGTPSLGSFIIHALGPRREETDAAVVVELVPGDHEVRKAADDPGFKQPVLVATNHHRKAGEPRSCSRYETARRAAGKHAGAMGTEELWKTLDKMRRSDTMQRMLFVPDTGEFRLSTLIPQERGKKKLLKITPDSYTPVDKTLLDEWWQ